LGASYTLSSSVPVPRFDGNARADNAPDIDALSVNVQKTAVLPAEHGDSALLPESAAPLHLALEPDHAAVIRESIRLRCMQSIRSVVPMSSALVATGALLWFFCPTDRLLAWLLSSFSMTVMRGLVCRRILSRLADSPDAALAGYNRQLMVSGALMATTSGAGVWWIAVGATTDVKFFVTLVLCIYAIAGLVNASSELVSFLLVLFGNLGQVTVFWLAQGSEGVPVAVLLIALLYLLSTFARHNAKSFAESIRIRFENIDLLAALSEEKKAVERALAKAEEANLAKSRFLAAASHDLRQPLHALSLWTGLLQESLTTPLALERAEKINQSVESLDKLFSGLLDLSRFDAGSITPERRRLCLADIFEVLDNDYRGAAEAKGLTFTVDKTDVWVESDSLWLERILRNLLTNAIKYTPRGSVRLTCEADAETARLVIRDTGIGIGPDEQKHIFEEYYQVHNPARNRDLGVGLGLAIVKRACDLLGHPLSVHSKRHAGSEFSLVLPRCPPQAESQVEESLPAESGEELVGFVVVVVEDDMDVAQAMSAVLQEWGCIPIICSNADEAIETLSRESLRPQAVISDYRLRQNATGMDVIATLRAKYGRLPAALVTGEMNPVSLITEQQPDYPVLQKPLAPERIKSLLLEFKSLEGPGGA
jgi:signal transduction histidine kinase